MRRGAGAAGANAATAEEIDQDVYGDSGDEENDAEREMIRESVSYQEDEMGSRSGQTSSLNPKKMSGTALAKAFLPSVSDVKQCLVYTDLAIKMQLIMFDLSSSVWWSSLAELLIWFPFSFFVFCVDPERMAFIWMFIPHLVRAAIGLIIIKKMPTSHEMVSKISIPPNEKIPFNKVSKFVVTAARDSALEFQLKAGKLLLVYAILTLFALLCDLIVVFIGVAGINNDSGAFSTVFIYLLGVVYFLIAFYFIGWAVAVRQRLPVYAQA